LAKNHSESYHVIYQVHQLVEEIPFACLPKFRCSGFVEPLDFRPLTLPLRSAIFVAIMYQHYR